MNVRSIINEKGSNVVTVAPHASLADIAATLSEKRIGAVVVLDRGAIRGIISERDIVRAVAKHGGEGLERRASDWMTAKVVTCKPDDTCDDVMEKMTTGRFRHLPVVEDGELGGIISIGDVVKRRIEEAVREAEQIREYITTA